MMSSTYWICQGQLLLILLLYHRSRGSAALLAVDMTTRLRHQQFAMKKHIDSLE